MKTDGKNDKNAVNEPIGYRDGIPIFEVMASGPHFVFTCPRCHGLNVHGAKDGHRASHCKCWPRGYFIQEANTQKEAGQ